MLTIVLHARNKELLVLLKGALQQHNFFVTLQEFSMDTSPVLFVAHRRIILVQHSETLRTGLQFLFHIELESQVTQLVGDLCCGNWRAGLEEVYINCTTNKNRGGSNKNRAKGGRSEHPMA